MVATVYKYTIENNLTKKREKRKKRNTQTHNLQLMFRAYYRSTLLSLGYSAAR